MDFGASMFAGNKEVSIPEECKIIFVSDWLVGWLPGWLFLDCMSSTLSMQLKR